MLQDIERIWIKLGRQPTSSDIKKGVSKYSLHAYAEHFGGWRGALEAFIEYINSDIPDKKDVIDSELCNVGDDKEEIKAKTDIHSQNDIKHKTSRNVSPGIRWKVMQRDNFKCRICGASPSTDSSVQLHIDHIVPWSKGGETTYENLQILWSKCNLGKGDMV